MINLTSSDFARISSRLRIRVFAFALLLAGCANTSSEFARQSQSWREIAPQSYEFEYSWQCFCPGAGVWWNLTVEGGRVTAATVVDSSTGAKGGVVPPGEGWPTIDSVFARVQRALATSDSVDVSYDSVFHFPSRVIVDRERTAIDDEWTIQIRRFRPRPAKG